jgi:three-Cys-motif partner protein
MASDQKFGGKWTIEKLSILLDYLNFYQDALKNQHFKKVYIDAFAGSGEISLSDSHAKIEGSARLALSSRIPFDQYYFIEKKKAFTDDLTRIVENEYSSRKSRVEIINDDCNYVLESLCKSINWRDNRALLFLDPYATEVKWSTLVTIAATKSIDVWYNFPFSAATRMLKRDGKIDPSWQRKINDVLGDINWFSEFYRPDPQITFLDDNESFIKDVNTNSLKEYICSRLKTIFPAVAENPRILYNAKNTPLFLFCFAIANDKQSAIDLALRVANHILNKRISE